MNTPLLLSLKVSVDYPGKREVLRDLCLDIGAGEILGLVGQSGCGKSTLALTILRLLHLKNGKVRGTVYFNGRELTQLKESEMRQLRGKEIGLVLQSPMSSLNPSLRIGKQLEEAWRVHEAGSKDRCRAALQDALSSVSLPPDDEFLRRFPSQLSVGQAQRVLIAMAAIHRPPLLIADEPTSALDIITQSEILDLFAGLSRKFGTSILYISHDLLSVATISQRVAVMERGQIVECRETAQLFQHPNHAYTQQLIRALPVQPTFAVASAGR